MVNNFSSSRQTSKDSQDNLETIEERPGNVHGSAVFVKIDFKRSTDCDEYEWDRIDDDVLEAVCEIGFVGVPGFVHVPEVVRTDIIGEVYHFDKTPSQARYRCAVVDLL